MRFEQNGSIIGPPISGPPWSGIFTLRRQLQLERVGEWLEVPSYSFINSYASILGGAPYTFSTDTVDPSLVVVTIGLEFSSQSSTSDIASVLIGDSIATNIVLPLGTGLVAISYTERSQNTTQITINMQRTALRCGIGVYSIQNYTSSTPVDSLTDSVVGSTTIGGTISVAQSNTVILGSFVQEDPSTTTWTGLQENYDTVTGENNTTFSGASIITLTNADVAVTAKAASGLNRSGLIVAAWR